MTDDELATAVSNSLGSALIVPRYRGLNGSLVSASQYDSINGWANVLMPTVAYRFNRHFSADASVPVFLYMQATHTAVATAPTSTALGNTMATTVVRRGTPGDTVIAGHWAAPDFVTGRFGSFADVLTGALSAPTGAVQDGIGAGKVTWNMTNHLQSNSTFAPYLDLGVGNSSRLTNPRLQSSQTSQGKLLNLGAGVSHALPRASTLYLEAYEQLPLGRQTVFQTVVRAGRPTVSQNDNGLAEDNGITLGTDVPVAPRVVWSGFYRRGLRLHEDTVGFSFAVLLRKPQPDLPR